MDNGNLLFYKNFILFFYTYLFILYTYSLLYNFFKNYHEKPSIHAGYFLRLAPF